MKNILLLGGLVALFVTGKVCAQGTVVFSSTSAAHQIQINCIPCQTGQATVALYGGVLGASEQQLVQIGATVVNGPDGFINGGTRTTPFASGGGMATFQIRAWTGGFATWEEAISTVTPGLLGVSVVFDNLTADPNSFPPLTPRNLTGWTSPVNMMPLTPFPCPEPSTVALGVLGAASLLFFRRR